MIEYEQDTIADAFTLNTGFRNNPYNYYTVALKQIRALRECSLFRCKLFPVPEPMPINGGGVETFQTVAAYSTARYTVRLIPNSYVWGLAYVEMQTNFTQTLGRSATIQITDACTGLDFFDDFLIASAFEFFRTTGSSYPPNPFPSILIQPKLIQDPGLLNVQVSNRVSGPLLCQLVLFVAEPAIREGMVK